MLAYLSFGKCWRQHTRTMARSAAAVRVLGRVILRRRRAWLFVYPVDYPSIIIAQVPII